MIRILINGIHGRVGRTILSHLNKLSGITCTGGIDLNEEMIPGFEFSIVRDIKSIISQGDVIIDFSAPAGTMEIINTCARKKKPLIIGTTGFSDSKRKKITQTSKKIPLLLSSNMSIGANLLFKEAGLAAEILSESFDVEIIDQHHKYKKDAPSGTALSAGDKIAKARKKSLDKIKRFGRGRQNPRKKGEITFHAVRGGHLLSEHTILFLGEHESFEITHRAYSREVFIDGLNKAVHFIVKKKPGLYDMMDVLNLK